jgi:hypothetical protein
MPDEPDQPPARPRKNTAMAAPKGQAAAKPKGGAKAGGKAPARRKASGAAAATAPAPATVAAPPHAPLSDLTIPPPPAGTPAPHKLAWRKLGVGVGSAGLVAALLYANRLRRKDWTK